MSSVIHMPGVASSHASPLEMKIGPRTQTMHSYMGYGTVIRLFWQSDNYQFENHAGYSTEFLKHKIGYCIPTSTNYSAIISARFYNLVNSICLITHLVNMRPNQPNCDALMTILQVLIMEKIAYKCDALSRSQHYYRSKWWCDTIVKKRKRRY